LHVNDQSTLIALLVNGTEIEIPNLSAVALEEIFDAHAKSVEEETFVQKNPFNLSLPFKMGDSSHFLSSSLEHSPEQADAPLIKPEILRKIVALTKAFGMTDLTFLSPSEPHCNCTYCQLARAMNGDTTQMDDMEEISDDDLKFRDWEIAQTEANLYSVTNPLDPSEHYSVFLGEPLGCTCGSKNCEHIKAVLKS
jgi:hypothetical protein